MCRCLDVTVDEGCEFFENIQNIKSKLITKTCWPWLYEDRPTSYNIIRWEAQGIKLAKEYQKDLLEELCIFGQVDLMI